MSSSSSSSAAAAQAATFSLDHLSHSSSEQLCYVHCNFCDTVLAVSVPYGSLFKTSVTVRCGHCSNLLNVINMRALHLPQANQIHHLGNTFLAPSHNNHLLEEVSHPTPPSLLHPPNTTAKESIASAKRTEESTQQSPAVNRLFAAPEKRQRVPSAYNRFIKDEIQRIKAGNPDITHREAFSAAAKNWAHFPHIHFGLTPDQDMKNNNVRQQDFVEHDVMLRDGFYTSAAATAVATANMGVTPF